jgi:hypothetical protein
MNALASSDLWANLIDQGEFVPVLAITLGATIGLVAIVSGAVGGIMKTRARETTRREIAAYVAEGSISPDDAVAMLNAGPTTRNSNGPCRKT